MCSVLMVCWLGGWDNKREQLTAIGEVCPSRPFPPYSLLCTHTQKGLSVVFR